MTMPFRAATIAAACLAAPAAAQTHDHHPGMAMPPAPATPPADHDMADMPGMAPPADHADHAMHDRPMMPGMMMPTDPTAFSADGSGTARVPADGGMMMMAARGDGGWSTMAHGYAWGVLSHQGGPRGDDMAFVQSMAMLTATRPVASGLRIQLRTMLSLDPLMGDRGYPNLFATGESAGGEALVDRQHPHDLFMELSARIDADLGNGRGLFLYAAPAGEPALGPSTFMHRNSARLNPEAPITHHWFDSTHISFGVLTAGAYGRHWQLEASAFNGREPGENRWDIERPRFSSWAARATWLPDRHWALSLSHARLKQPERLHPGEDEARTVASVAYDRGGTAVTVGMSWKDRRPGPTLAAAFVEGTAPLSARDALFARIERVRNDELFDHGDPLHDRPFTVAKLTGGYAHSLPLGGGLLLDLGGSLSAYAKPALLDPAYGRHPLSGTLFAKLSFMRM